MSFEVGDVVKLKSGSPEMTVSKPGRRVMARGVNVEGRETVKVFCQWFEKGELRRGSFNQEELELCNEREQSGD